MRSELKSDTLQDNWGFLVSRLNMTIVNYWLECALFLTINLVELIWLHRDPLILIKGKRNKIYITCTCIDIIYQEMCNWRCILITIISSEFYVVWIIFSNLTTFIFYNIQLNHNILWLETFLTSRSSYRVAIKFFDEIFEIFEYMYICTLKWDILTAILCNYYKIDIALFICMYQK